RSDDVNVQIDTKTIYRESCGCNMQPAMEIKDLRMEYQNKCLIYEEALDSLKCMELDLTGLENIDELCEKMKKYVVGSDMQSFYMCLCDKNELFADKSVCDHFTEKVSIPLAYQNGKFCSYDDFLSKEILPLEIREKSKRTFYTVTPIYYQHICYGYCVSDGSLFALKSELSYLWTVNIGMALENIRKWQWINRMNEKINRMWKYDMLTQVLNRSGFFYCAETILQKIKEEKSNAFIIFLDIDGLKSVNDNLGHEIGDAFIAKIAGILKEVVPKDCLIMRYGGDEFVVFGSCKQAGRMQRIAEDIKAAIKTADQKENRSYHLAASLGCSLHKSYEMDNLNSLIELADKKMYEEKKNKRR
ncbi:GGDEF domain-containing protein, partial [Ruminococcus bicirculans (ex Wegman et al. 2014)]